MADSSQHPPQGWAQSRAPGRNSATVFWYAFLSTSIQITFFNIMLVKNQTIKTKDSLVHLCISYLLPQLCYVEINHKISVTCIIKNLFNSHIWGDSTDFNWASSCIFHLSILVGFSHMLVDSSGLKMTWNSLFWEDRVVCHPSVVKF